MAPRWYRRNQRAGVGSGTLRDAEGRKRVESGRFLEQGAPRLAPAGRTGQEQGRSRKGTAHDGRPRKRCVEGRQAVTGRQAGAPGKGQGPEAGHWGGGRANPAARLPSPLCRSPACSPGRRPATCQGGASNAWGQGVPRRFEPQARREGCRLLASATPGPHNRSHPRHTPSLTRISRLWPQLISLIKPKVASRHSE